MLSTEFKYLLYTVSGCFAYPTGVWVMIKSSLAALASGVVHSKAAVCHVNVNALCFSSHLAIYLFAALFFALGAVVAWQDLISGRRIPDSNGRGLSSLFRSAWLVRRSWFALPVLALLLLAIAVKELL